MANIRKVVKKLIPDKLFVKIEPFGHLIEAILANIRYGFPSRKMHVIGVTGTNGKTTTTSLIYRMLYEAGFKVGMLSTVAYGANDDIKQQIEHLTTAPAGILQRRLRDFKHTGVDWVVVETSSHSLAQHRTWGLPYEIAVMTNVTNDHLDYHGTFDNYLAAKRRLFKIAAKHGRKFGVVNADDPNAQKFVDSIPRAVTYGITGGELRASKLILEIDHSTFQANIGQEKYNVRINMPGEFNISNSLAAIAVGRELGLNKEQIEQGIAALKGVEGRMAIIDEGQRFRVIVDHASTPDAFEKFFASIRPATKGKLIAVFGSAGRRDEAKRAIQGEIAGRYCDEVIVTEEDDRDIDGNLILGQIADGAQKAGKIKDKDLFLILDREKAIAFALGHAEKADDTVVLLGKGHEKTIERADGEHPWNETEITKKALRLLGTKD
jgi:UDP-N-acetylmuramoyl-L-alanyl-D-glutamate--2,6-diaminopimelate ligase